jgi:hypothetical protein
MCEIGDVCRSSTSRSLLKTASGSGMDEVGMESLQLHCDQFAS